MGEQPLGRDYMSAGIMALCYLIQATIPALVANVHSDSLRASFLAELHFRRAVATQEARGFVETFLFERDLARVAQLLRTVRLFKAHLRDFDRSGATHVD